MYYFAYYNFELIIRYLYFQKVSLDVLIDKTQITHHISQKRLLFISQKRLLFVQVNITILFRKGLSLNITYTKREKKGGVYRNS